LILLILQDHTGIFQPAVFGKDFPARNRYVNVSIEKSSSYTDDRLRENQPGYHVLNGRRNR